MKRLAWGILQLAALFLLLGYLPLGYLLGQPLTGWTVFLAVVLLHLAELGVTIPLARRRGYPIGTAVVKTLLFGFTWWVPFRRGILDR